MSNIPLQSDLAMLKTKQFSDGRLQSIFENVPSEFAEFSFQKDLCSAGEAYSFINILFYRELN